MGEFEFRQKVFETAVGGGTYMQAIIVNFTLELETTVQGQNLNLGLLHCWDYGNGWALWLIRTEGYESSILFVWSVIYVCIYIFLKLFKSNVIMVRNSNSSKKGNHYFQFPLPFLKCSAQIHTSHFYPNGSKFCV